MDTEKAKFSPVMINKCADIDELLALWKLAHKCEINTEYIAGNVPAYAFLPDGIIDEIMYEQIKEKILYIAKEAYWYGENDDEKAAEKNAQTVMFWHREVAFGRVPETIFSKRLSMLTNAIFSNDFKTINKQHEVLRSVAVMNLNKRGGFVGCNRDVLEEYVKRYCAFIAKEIQLIAPQLIICCGDDVKYLLDKYVSVTANIKIIKVSHPSYFALTDAAYLQQLQRALVAVESEKVNVAEKAQKEKPQQVQWHKEISAEHYMKARNVNSTLDFNRRANVYYDCLEHGFSEHEYIALYKEKCIHAVGKINAIITAVVTPNGIVYQAEQGELTEERKQTIVAAIADGKRYGYDLKEYRYFFVEKFFHTCYRKISSGGVRTSRNFNLNEVLGVEQMPATEEIAKMLDGKTWE